ncbi:MAG: site-2 protease family protein, partial [Myxococcota bacterium]
MSESPESADADASELPAPKRGVAAWRLPIVLFLLTVISTLWVGAQMNGVEAPGIADLWRGWNFSLPLMAILLAHEMGHYVAGRIHG